VSIGDNVHIGKGTIIESVSIGSNVYIGENCVLSKRTVVKDCCWISDGTLLTPDTVVPPFSIYGGVPGIFVGELPASAPEVLKLIIREKKTELTK